MMNKKKNYVHYKKAVFEFIMVQPQEAKVAILTRFEFIEYGLDNHWIERKESTSKVIVKVNGTEYEFQCVYKIHDGNGMIEIINARIVNEKVN